MFNLYPVPEVGGIHEIRTHISFQRFANAEVLWIECRTELGRIDRTQFCRCVSEREIAITSLLDEHSG